MGKGQILHFYLNRGKKKVCVPILRGEENEKGRGVRMKEKSR